MNIFNYKFNYVDQDISELLLDPANFQRVDENENPKSGPNLVLDSSKIPDAKKLFEGIEKTYNNLYEKLSLWLTLTTSGVNIFNNQDIIL
jgi:hypothetical protein